MTVLKTLFNEVFLFKPEQHKDQRGNFIEGFNQKTFNSILGKKIIFCQDNFSFSKKGVLRGLHYQLPPYCQSKLVSVIKGEVLDVVVDLRKGSPTFGKYYSKELSANNGIQIFVPRGFAHGYITLSKTSILMYKVDQHYHPESEGGINPDDKELGIDWKLSKSIWIRAEKDKKHPNLNQAILFDFNQNLYD